MKKKTPSEHFEQREFVKWFRQNQKYFIFAIPNGGKRSIVTAARLKAEGAEPGVPDLQIPELRLFIEMKKSDGTLKDVSFDQNRVHKILTNCCNVVLVCFGCEDAKKQFLKFASDFKRFGI